MKYSLPSYWPLLTLICIAFSSFLYGQWVTKGNPISFISAIGTSITHWDTLHYLTIAEKGYTTPFQLAFPPGYPWVVRALSHITGNYLISGILLSLGSLIFYVYATKKLSSLYLSEKASQGALSLHLLFPSAYFLLIPYSESLFLSLSTLAFLAFSERKWGMMGLWSGLATLTRSVGVLLLPTLLIGILFNQGLRAAWFKKGASLLLIPFAVGIHWMFVYRSTGSWLGVFTIHKELGNRGLVFPLSSLVTNIQMIPHLAISEYTVQVVYAETIAVLFMLILTVISFFVLPRLFAFYNLLYLLLISSSSFLISNPRLLLGAFPIFWALSVITQDHPILYRTVLCVFSLLLAIEFATFSRGHWAF